MSLLSAFLIPISIVASANSSPLLQDVLNLRMSAPEGTEFSYRMQMEIDAGGQLIVLKANSIMKIAKVEPNGDYTVESELRNAAIDMGDGEQEVPTRKNMTKSNLKGEILEVRTDGEEPDQEGYRFPNLTTWSFEEASYKIGDTITITRRSSKTTGGRDSETTIKILQMEDVQGRNTVKVEFSAKETSGDSPATYEGTGWIDPKVGMMVKLEATFKNVPFPGAPFPLDGKVSYISN